MKGEWEKTRAPYTSEELNAAHARLKNLGEGAQTELKLVVDVLGEKLDLPSTISKIEEKYGKQENEITIHGMRYKI